jgi:pentatricopeptide repeat domain-containing protein 1
MVKRRSRLRCFSITNVMIIVLVCMGFQSLGHVKAFQFTIHKRNMHSQQHICNTNKIVVNKQTHPLITTAASLIQDAIDSPDTASSPFDSTEQMQSSIQDSNVQSIEKCKINNIFTLINVLQPYASSYNKHNSNKQHGNREIENQILRLGQKGRTAKALQLYFSVYSLDRIRNMYRSKSMSLQSKGKEIDASLLISDIIHNNMGWEKSDNADQEISLLQNLLEQLKNIRPTTRLLNLAIDACARAHPVRQDMAFSLFQSACVDEKAISPNVFTFGSLLASCARNRDIDTSLQLLHDIESGKYLDVVPNGVIYSTVISACERSAGDLAGSGNNNMIGLALELLNNATLALSMDTKSGQSSERGNGIGVVGFNAAISTMARGAEWKLAVQLLDEMIMQSKYVTGAGVETNFTTAAALLHVIKDERYSDRVFFIPKPDEVTFGTVLAACERAGEWEELLRIARTSKEYGVTLDGIALTSVLHACQQLGLADEALDYLDLMKQLGSKDANNESRNGMAERRTNGRMRKGAKQALRGPDGVAYRLAISACARSPGRWQDGLRLLDEMRESANRSNNTANAPDVVAYTAAIAGCSEAGEYRHAIRLIKTMKAEGIQPNVVTFSAVINACASASAQLSKRKEDGDRSIESDDVKLPMLKGETHCVAFLNFQKVWLAISHCLIFASFETIGCHESANKFHIA